ncbi:MAG: tRNA 4-thiouridine(8) synthase ThiI [Firmicutes bacterium]|nr:tRNA 4-thiouridine(8) synthase ThiI [Bacillota bacterium]
MNKEIMIKFGEIFLKGDNRKKFESSLIQNIYKKISKFGEFKIFQMGSVLTICGESLEILIPEIKKIFGISSFALACMTEKNIEKIKTAVKKEFEFLKLKSFKVEAKRADKSFYLNSFQICQEIGSFVSKEFNSPVDVHNPSAVINIEIRNNAYIFTKSYKGAGGLPSGVSGLGTVLISGGIDSPVAAFMISKRGLKLNAVHFSSPPYTSYRSVDKVKRLLGKISHFSGKIRLFNINFTDIQKTIQNLCSDELHTVIYRRVMNKIAEYVANSEKSLCLINGESLGQVASQTLNAINCTSNGISLPILRPLIGFDKHEIIEISKKIGTFEISIEPFEDCCSMFNPKRPKIKPMLKFVEIEENKIKELENMMRKAFLNCEILECTS